MNLIDYVAMVRTSRNKGKSENWQKIRELLQAGPMTTRELSEALGRNMNSTKHVLIRMRKAGEVQHNRNWQLK